MALTVAQHIAELSKRFPLCGPREQSETFYYSFQKVVREHPWPFCIAEDRIVTEVEYSTGTVAVTNGGTGVVGTGTTWLTAWTTAPSTRRVVIAGRPESYRVATVTDVANLVLRDAWIGETGTALNYRMYREVYTLPSNCGYAGEYILVDPQNNRAVKLKNYGTLIDRAMRNYAAANSATWAARVDLTATGLGQVLFDPPPSDVQVFPLLYFRSATKPVSLAVLPDPLFPSDAEDLIWKRMLVEYAKDPRHKRSDWRDFQSDYDDTLLEAKRRFDGGAELDVRLHNTYPNVGSIGMNDVFTLTIGEYNP